MLFCATPPQYRQFIHPFLKKHTSYRERVRTVLRKNWVVFGDPAVTSVMRTVLQRSVITHSEAQRSLQHIAELLSYEFGKHCVGRVYCTQLGQDPDSWYTITEFRMIDCGTPLNMESFVHSKIILLYFERYNVEHMRHALTTTIDRSHPSTLLCDDVARMAQLPAALYDEHTFAIERLNMSGPICQHLLRMWMCFDYLWDHTLIRFISFINKDNSIPLASITISSLLWLHRGRKPVVRVLAD